MSDQKQRSRLPSIPELVQNQQILMQRFDALETMLKNTLKVLSEQPNAAPRALLIQTVSNAEEILKLRAEMDLTVLTMEGVQHWTHEQLSQMTGNSIPFSDIVREMSSAAKEEVNRRIMTPKVQETPTTSSPLGAVPTSSDTSDPSSESSASNS
jgi:hypothetical protein